MCSITTKKRKRFCTYVKRTKADKNIYCVFEFFGNNLQAVLLACFLFLPADDKKQEANDNKCLLFVPKLQRHTEQICIE